jgi:hypothetical protein
MHDAETQAPTRPNVAVTCPVCAQAHDPAGDRVTTSYRSIVLHIPATPQPLLAERWTVDHWCNLCRQRVAPAQLIAHAQDHEHAGHGAHRPQTP